MYILKNIIINLILEDLLINHTELQDVLCVLVQLEFFYGKPLAFTRALSVCADACFRAHRQRSL